MPETRTPQSWTLDSIGPQAGKRFFITGANSGIGYETAVELARRGAVVVMACRDLQRGQVALDRLRRYAAGPDSAAEGAELVPLDLASLASVGRAAETELARQKPLHGLINNAGVFAPPRRRVSEDGFELQFATNVLGHFALTCRLLPALAMASAGGPGQDAARIVTLSSIAHKRARLKLDDLQSERGYRPTRAYAQSKLADLMFALALERRLRAAGLSPVSLAAHPGVAETALFKIGNGKGLAGFAERAVAITVGLALNSTLAGALPTLYAATSPAARGGGYYGPQGLGEMRGSTVGPAQVSKQAQDGALQDRLWQACEALTGTSIGL